MQSMLNWKFLLGGICKYGDHATPRRVPDLWWTVTPITWSQAGRINLDGSQNTPITGCNLIQAMQLAEELEGRLPTSLEWEWMAAGPEKRLYPWGDASWDISRANLAPSFIDQAVDVGSFLLGATPDGLLDVAGNVWELTSTRISQSGVIIRGGSYRSQILYARTGFLNAVPVEISSQGIGIRLVRSNG